jgi:ATP-dependent helicase/nuclease subunit A
LPQEKVSLTEEQKVAVEFEGNNLLVSAAAGSGKTFVLVERIIRQLLSREEPCDIERLLVVTFTEKAALEMKERIRAALHKARERNPEDPRIARQLSLLERAQISTIHSFCLSIVRRYFYRVDLDPGFRVLDPNEAELLRYEAVDGVFEERYGSDSDDNGLFVELVEGYGGRGVDESLKQIVLGFHDFLQTQPHPREWLSDALGLYEQVAKALSQSGLAQDELDRILLALPWTALLLEQIESELDEAITRIQQARALCRLPRGPQNYLSVLEQELAGLKDAHRRVQELLEISSNLSLECRQDYSEAGAGSLESLRSLAGFKFQRLPARKKEADPSLADLAKAFREKARKCLRDCASNVIMRPAAGVLKEIADLLPLMETFVKLVIDLDSAYTRKKKAVSGVDFSDLERYTLDVLRQEGGRLAEDIRSCYDFVFVDEYQDTNPVQDEILALVSQDDNLFMVGDIKQSIYRFRLADPTIFIAKYMAYAPVGESTYDASLPGVRTGLSLNFRSRKQVIDAVNYLFQRIMKQSVAEIDYTGEHRLNLGANYPEVPGYKLATELLLVERDDLGEAGDAAQGGSQAGDETGMPPRGAVPGEPGDLGGPEGQGDSDIEQLEALEREALLVAWKIKEMVEPDNGFKVWDAKASEFRQCMFRDIAVLMRSTKGRANVVLDIFQKCGIPVYAELGTGYFRAREVEVALSLLAVIDNPRQDIPLASVLRSPVAGLTPRQLAIIKALCPKGEFHDSVGDFAALEPDDLTAQDLLSRGFTTHEILRLREAVSKFLEHLARWRTMARRMPLAHVLWTVLGETGYYDYVGGLPGGAQRQANLRALVNRAMEFDKFGRHGLFRFLRFIDRIRESKGDLGSARALGEQEDVVRVLSVHKSKGLEFPVVFVIDLGKQFNMEDLKSDILFHRNLGIGAMYCDLENKVKYPTLPFRANQIQIRKDNLAEEMRILYVAMTRAKEKLFLVGSARQLAAQVGKWQDMRLDRAQSYLDWICPSVLPKLRQVMEQDECSAMDTQEIPFDIQVFGLPGMPGIPDLFSTSQGGDNWKQVKQLMPLEDPGNPEVHEQVKQRLEWAYPYRAFTYMPAKMSVSELKSRLDFEDEFQEFVPAPEQRLLSKGKTSYGIERGIAVHALLAKMDLTSGECEEKVRQEIQRLSSLGFLDSQYVRPEDVTRIAGFFRSDTGRMLMAHPHKVKREIQFAIGIPVSGTRLIFSANEAELPVDDSIVVQGVIDVVFESDDGLWIIDYKTDSITSQQLPRVAQSYTPQVALYAHAAEQILKVPVVHVSLVFLTPGKEVPVDWRTYLSDIRLDDILPLARES